jgi:flavodoxin
MLSIELPTDVEKHFVDMIKRSYNGNVKSAIVSLMKMHDKYRWKEQLADDVNSIRKEVRRKGGIHSKDIENAIKNYRKNKAKPDA